MRESFSAPRSVLTSARLQGACVALTASALAARLSPGSAASPDSTNYLNAALHLVAGDGFVTSTIALNAHEPARLTLFPPGFSAAIAALMHTGLAPRVALALVMGFAFVLYALASFWVLRRTLPERWSLLSVPLALSLAIQPALREAVGLALSDLPGAGFAVLSVAVAMHTASPTRTRALAIGALLGVAMSVRWANLYVALSVCLLFLLFGWPGADMRTRLRSLASLVLPMGLIVGPMWLLNLRASGTLMGFRVPEPSDPIAQLGRGLVGASRWFVDAHASLHGPSWFLALHAAAALLVALCFLAAAFASEDFRARLCLGVVLGYLLLMVLSASITRYDPLSDARFWLLVPPLAVAGAIRLVVTGLVRPRSPGTRVHWLQLAALVWGVLFVHATFASAQALGAELRGPARFRGYFEPHLDHSRVLRRALALHDTGECELAASDEFVLLPRMGTRTLHVIGEDELPVLGNYHGAPLCIVVLHDARLPWTLEGEHGALRGRLQKLAHHGLLSLDQADDVAELWRTPAALFSARAE